MKRDREVFLNGNYCWSKEGEFSFLYQSVENGDPELIKKMRNYISLSGNKLLYQCVERDEWYSLDPVTRIEKKIGILFCHIGSKCLFLGREKGKIRFTAVNHGLMTDIICLSWKWFNKNSLQLETREGRVILEIV